MTVLQNWNWKENDTSSGTALTPIPFGSVYHNWLQAIHHIYVTMCVFFQYYWANGNFLHKRWCGTDKVLDIIMPMAKYYILRCRCLKAVPNLFSERSRAMRSYRKTHLVTEVITDIQLCTFHYSAHTSR